MALNILGGRIKGTVLKVPPGDMIRPMSVLLKRKIFDSRQNLQGYTFVDLCAGSGAVGLEAWSRNADKVYFCEIHKKVFLITSGNIKKVQELDEASKAELSIQNRDCLSWLKNDFQPLYENSIDPERWILFFAPPYPDHKLYEKTLSWLNDQSWYKGELWVESCKDKGIIQEKVLELYTKEEPFKTVKQGSSFLICF